MLAPTCLGISSLALFKMEAIFLVHYFTIVPVHLNSSILTHSFSFFFFVVVVFILLKEKFACSL